MKNIDKKKKTKNQPILQDASIKFKRNEESTSVSSQNENSSQDGFKKGRKAKKGERKPFVLCVSKEKRKHGLSPIGRRTRSQTSNQ